MLANQVAPLRDAILWKISGTGGTVQKEAVTAWIAGAYSRIDENDRLLRYCDGIDWVYVQALADKTKKDSEFLRQGIELVIARSLRGEHTDA
jgi:hypothetical protein